MITQAVTLSFPVSTVYATNAWNHDPSSFDKQERIAFYDPGFPTEARVIKRRVIFSFSVGFSWPVAT